MPLHRWYALITYMFAYLIVPLLLLRYNHTFTSHPDFQSPVVPSALSALPAPPPPLPGYIVLNIYCYHENYYYFRSSMVLMYTVVPPKGRRRNARDSIDIIL